MTETRARYGNRRAIVDGIAFASRAEAHRYRDLRLMEQAGEIRELVVQPRFELVPGVELDGRKKPAIRYVADFSYLQQRGPDSQQWELIVEDVKSPATAADPVYRLKRHLLKVLRGIDVQEVER